MTLTKEDVVLILVQQRAILRAASLELGQNPRIDAELASVDRDIAAARAMPSEPIVIQGQ